MIFSTQRKGTVPVLDLEDPYKMYGYMWYVDFLDDFGSPRFASAGFPYASPITIEDVGTLEKYMQSEHQTVVGTSYALGSGSFSDWNQAEGFYYDNNDKDFKQIGSNQKFTVRPYFFDRLFSAAGLTIYINAYNANQNKRPHFKNGVTDSTSGMYFVPLFATPVGLLAPTDWTGLGLNSVASGTSGITVRDKWIRMYSNGYYRYNGDLINVPVCGVAVMFDSAGSGSLINTDNLFIGQTDGITSVVANGRVVGDFVYLNQEREGFYVEYDRAFVPFGSNTCSGLKQVTVSMSVID